MLRNKYGFIAKIINKGIKEGVMLTVLAEEPTTEPTPSGDTTPQAQPTINYEDLIARARKEEKDKLYPKIQKLEKDNSDLVTKNNQALLTIGTKDTEIAELKAELEKLKGAKPSDSEEVKALKKEVKELKGQISEYEANTVDVESIKQGIVAEYEVKLYKEQKLREVGDCIIPELVIGDTKEAIDQAIEVSKQRYEAIVGKVTSSTPAINVIPPSNVSTSTLSKATINTEDISKMSATEWAEYRKQLKLR